MKNKTDIGIRKDDDNRFIIACGIESKASKLLSIAYGDNIEVHEAGKVKVGNTLMGQPIDEPTRLFIERHPHSFRKMIVGLINQPAYEDMMKAWENFS